MDVNSWRDTNVKYASISNSSSLIPDKATMEDKDRDKDLRQQQLEEPIDLQQDETDNPYPDDLQQKDEDSSLNPMQLFSRAGEGDGPTGSTVAPDDAKAASNAAANNNRLEGLFNNIASDARSEFGGVTPESIPDVNIYQHKKTVAQGMMDLALFSANANQLRYVVESNNHPYFWPGVILIGISLIFQVGVGVGLLLNTRYNVKDKKEICVANKINNLTIVGIFLVTVINVFISAFGVASGGAPVVIAPRSGDGAE